MLEILHNKTIQALSGWIGLLTCTFAILGWLTPEWWGRLTWAQALLGALGAAIVSSFCLAATFFVGACAFRLVWPVSQPAAASTSSSEGNRLTQDGGEPEWITEIQQLRHHVEQILNAQNGRLNSILTQQQDLRKAAVQCERQAALGALAAECISRRERAEVRRQIVDKLDQWEPLIGPHADSGTAKFAFMQESQVTSDLPRLMESIGFTKEIINKSKAARKRAIDTENEFAIVRADDPWKTADEKKAWHRARTSLFVHRELIKSRYEPSMAGAEYLLALTQIRGKS